MLTYSKAMEKSKLKKGAFLHSWIDSIKFEFDLVTWSLVAHANNATVRATYLYTNDKAASLLTRMNSKAGNLKNLEVQTLQTDK